MRSPGQQTHQIVAGVNSSAEQLAKGVNENVRVFSYDKEGSVAWFGLAGRRNELEWRSPGGHMGPIACSAGKLTRFANAVQDQVREGQGNDDVARRGPISSQSAFAHGPPFRPTYPQSLIRPPHTPRRK